MDWDLMLFLEKCVPVHVTFSETYIVTHNYFDDCYVEDGFVADLMESLFSYVGT